MLTREEKKQRNHLFWEEFRKYMSKVKSVNGRRMNWLNYPTDVKNMYVRLVVDSRSAKVCLDIQPKDDGIRAIIWEQMTELKKVLSDSMNQEAEWFENFHDNDGRLISRIVWEKIDVNFYNEADKEAIFEFLKNRLIEFDEFYQEFKEILIALTK